MGQGLTNLAQLAWALGDKVHPGFRDRIYRVEYYAFWQSDLFDRANAPPSLRKAALDALIGVVAKPIFALITQVAGVIYLIRAPFAAICRLTEHDRDGAITELVEMKTIVKVICVLALNYIPAYSCIVLGIYACRTERNPTAPEFRRFVHA